MSSKVISDSEDNFDRYVQHGDAMGSGPNATLSALEVDAAQSVYLLTITTLYQRLKHWLRESAWPGAGLFGESYLLFSIGTLKPIWESVVLGVISGMIVVGYLANSIGRRKGSILTASIMAGGAAGMFFATFIGSPLWIYRCMCGLLFVFGVGVGGEYPLSASSASENASQDKSHQKECDAVWVDENTVEHRKDSRGVKVQLVFAMQGMGIWFNCTTLLLLLSLMGQADNGDYDSQSLLFIWRVTYIMGVAILFFVLVSRCLYLEESRVWADDKWRREHLEAPCEVVSSEEVICSPQQKQGVPTNLEPLGAGTQGDQDRDVKSRRLLLDHFGMRLFGASMSWLLWDISFYGNKLFQASFLLALTGEETTLAEFASAATLNATVALLGYFGAAFLVDNPRVGRLQLQTVGFLVTGALFVLCGFAFDKLSSSWLVSMYLASSFFGQLGPNATTFLVPAEIFPTEMRTFCHGICAAAGKLGALIAAVAFNYLKSDADLFLMSGYASFVACAITAWTIPETSGLDLLEIDRKWRLCLGGRSNEYVGPANDPKHLSMFENWNNRKAPMFQSKT